MILKIITWTSAVLLILVLCLVTAGARLHPLSDYVSLSPDVHLSVSHGRFIVFNNAKYGPYDGSVDTPGYESARYIEKTAFGERCGLYYRYCRTAYWSLWTVKVSLLYPILIFAVLPLVWFVRAVAALRRAKAGAEQPSQ